MYPYWKQGMDIFIMEGSTQKRSTICVDIECPVSKYRSFLIRHIYPTSQSLMPYKLHVICVKYSPMLETSGVPKLIALPWPSPAEPPQPT